MATVIDVTEPASAALNAEDQAILDNVPAAIAQGRDLKAWWERARKIPELLGRFPVSRQFHQPNVNFGFLHDAVLRAGVLPVAGVTQDQLFDFPKVPAGMSGRDPQWVRDQAREFMMRYFMRLTYTAVPNLVPQGPEKQPPRALAPLSRCGPGGAKSYGWGYEQWYYQLAGSGEIGKFPDSQRYQTIDLREIGPKYSWVVFKIDIFHFDFTIPPVPTGPQLQIPMPQPVYAVCTPDFVVNQENPRPGVLGEYGYGYSVVPNPNYKTLFAAGPSKITNTIETLHLRVLDTGEVRAHMDFVTPQPPQILEFKPVEWSFRIADLFTFGAASTLLAPVKRVLEGFEPDIDPVYTSVRLLNLLTLGVAADDYCITKEQLFKLLMVLHFTDAFNMFTMTASHFRMVPDWTDTQSLPDWARYGTFSGTSDFHF
jgi:hypothetical protein